MMGMSPTTVVRERSTQGARLKLAASGFRLTLEK